MADNDSTQTTTLESFERARPGDSVTLVAGDRSTKITIGFRQKITSWIKDKANSVWDRMTPENFLFFYLTRWDKDPAEAVHRSCAYYLSSFGGVPSHILTSQDCEDFYATLSDKLAAEIAKAKEDQSSDNPSVKAAADTILNAVETAKNWDPEADSDMLDEPTDESSSQSIYE